MAITFLLTECQGLQTAIQGGDTIANTAAATNFASNYVVPAGDLNVVGRMVRLKAWGKYNTDLLLGRNITLDVMAGATVLCSTGVITLTLAGAVNDPWKLECDIACRTTGAGGTVEVQGQVEFANAAVAEDVAFMPNAATVGLDLTVAQTLQIRVTWAVADPDNSIQMRMFSGEIMGQL